MKFIKLFPVLLAVLIVAACSASKKATTPTVSAPPAPAVPAAPVAKAANGVFAPGNEELTAIQAKYKDVTMHTLTDGYAIYTGTCTGCHGAKSIYKRPEDAWRGIIDDMALKAKITDVQKDAVYKYVMAIKATQPKEAK